MGKTQEERSETTRSTLVQIGRELFGNQGFTNTSIDQIVRKAKVTKGALYHHFAGKKELFSAVTEEVEGEVIQNAFAAINPDDSTWEKIEAGVLHFLGECVDPEIQQILLHDGPVVLGWERWHYSDRRTATDTIYDYLNTIEGLETLNRATLGVLTNMLSGMLMEAAKTIAYSDDSIKARETASILIKNFIKSIRQSAVELAEIQ